MDNNAMYRRMLSEVLADLDTFENRYYELSEGWTNYIPEKDQRDLMNAFHKIRNILNRCKEDSITGELSKWK